MDFPDLIQLEITRTIQNYHEAINLGKYEEAKELWNRVYSLGFSLYLTYSRTIPYLRKEIGELVENPEIKAALSNLTSIIENQVQVLNDLPSSPLE